MSGANRVVSTLGSNSATTGTCSSEEYLDSPDELGARTARLTLRMRAVVDPLLLLALRLRVELRVLTRNIPSSGWLGRSTGNRQLGGFSTPAECP